MKKSATERASFRHSRKKKAEGKEREREKEGESQRKRREPEIFHPFHKVYEAYPI